MMEEHRERLDDTRESVTHKAVIHGIPEKCPHCAKEVRGGRTKFFFTVGLYPDGRPSELFLHMDESGSTLDGFADAWSVAVSVCLQSGTPLKKLVEKFSYQEFEPKGRSEEVGYARSVIDYVVRWMDKEFGV
jgi:ribonucleoside-diphosphate reductase alpha chain